MKQEEKRVDFPSRRRLKQVVLFLFAFLAAIGVVLEFVLWVRVNFWLEIVATYTPQLVLLSFSILFMIFAITVHVGIDEGWGAIFKHAKKRIALALIGLITFTHILVVSSNQPTRAKYNPEATEKVSVMTLNKLYSNDSYQQIVNYVNLQQPDILAFQEIYKFEAELLAEKLGYEHWHIASCGCSAKGSDLALFSKFPVISADMSFEDELGGALRAEIELGVDETLIIYNTHIVPPYKQKYYDLRRDMFMELADNVSNETETVVVVGDFNASPASIDLRSFAAQEHGLLMAAEQQLFSKCSWFGFSALFCARIDHVFIPPDSTITFQNISPFIGSDHRAVHVGISY